jgi:LAO/AO transport system kinase
MTLYEKFLQGSEAALSRVISHIEDNTDGYQKLLAQLYRRRGTMYRIGITGPPGAGKSSLVNRLAGLLAERGDRVAVICVDPTSPFTGGALLGDRLRIKDIPVDKGIYIRSMASRGSSGGLAAATNNVLVALEAFGFDILLIETVGVGQMELDVVDSCDTVVVALVPESGDAIQALKAGLMEIADVFAVNKADREGAERSVADLKSSLELRAGEPEWRIPVVPTQALNNRNIDLLLNEIDRHRGYMESSGELVRQRRSQLGKTIEQVITRLVRLDLMRSVLTEDIRNKIVTAIQQGRDDPYSAARRLYHEFKPRS